MSPQHWRQSRKPMSNSKTPWLNNTKNGTGQDSSTWRGDTRPRPLGDTWTKAALVEHLRRAGLIK